ncbi:hypothetical protein EZV62_004856 [Acer yangbiense]|uniref:Glycosyltransferase n=1 Tax=Acer yangbiense TaxID=1000413 RepID=A0A5C7IL39_9ROSI|nr:hypothetical protein EZV62_004856 [Acer yangbiense]
MGNPHVLVIPYPAQGHVLPLMELSQCLAKHGIKITFVNTEFVHKLVVNALGTEHDVANSIRLVSIPDVNDQIEEIFLSMPVKVKELIEQINASDGDNVTCVLADNFLGWAMEIAVDKEIKRAAFSVIAATASVSVSSIPKLMEDGIIGYDGNPTKKQMVQLSPFMPPMKTSHFVWVDHGVWKDQNLFFDYSLRNNRSIELADWVLCNSTYDLEPEPYNLNPKILPIGPLVASNRSGNSVGNFLPEDLSCLKWLDQQPTQSVIYVAFGSHTTFDQTQFEEFALGLELSNRPFLWVVRPDIANKLNDTNLEGFQDRVGSRGLIISWAPQQKVLEHPSIAYFFSHCGWNSTMEALSNGVPLLCWPFSTDQFLNEHYICNVWKVGLGFNRDDGGIITREEIKNKSDELLSGENYKANTLNLKEKLLNSIKQGGSSYTNFMTFVAWVKA